jgi:DNA-directed RNA polymerase, mitochondrial
MLMNEDYKTQLNKQLDLEGEYIKKGKERFWKNLQNNKEKGRHSVTPAFIYLQKELVINLSNCIKEFTSQTSEGLAGKRRTSFYPLQLINNPEKVSYITIKTAIDCIATHKTLLQTALRIGNMLQIEVNSVLLKKEKPLLYSKILKDLMKRTSNIEHRKRVFSHELTKFNIQGETWTLNKQAQVGQQLIDLLIQVTSKVQDGIQVETIFKIKPLHTGRNKTVNYLVMTDEILTSIKNAEFNCSVLTPYYMPMVLVPKNWTTPYTGGFISEYLAKQPLIKTHDHKYLHELENSDLTSIYDAVNHLQHVPFKIDKEIFDIEENIYRNDLPLGGFTTQESLLDAKGKPRLYRDPRVDTDKELRIQYKRDCTRVYTAEIVRTSKVISDRTSLEVASVFKDTNFYFSKQLDTRGRMYYVSSTFNPQSDHKVKALISFANGEPIGERGIYWLYVHTANMWGFDKGTYDERYEWTKKNKADIVSYSQLPFQYKSWNDADKPMEFLKACMHVAKVEEQGSNYVCDLPVSVDATCSGLQILSMLMRDRNTAEKVNVTPSERPQDIYSIIAEKVKKEVDEFTSQGVPEAVRWSQFGITRKIVKRNIMTYVYGLKPYGARVQIFDEYKSIIEKNPELKVLSDDGWNDCKWLSDIVWKHIQIEVKLASDLMKWFQDCAKLFAQNNIPLQWITPMNLLVKQDYRYLVPFRIKTAINGSLVYTTLRKQIDKQDSRKSQSSSAPNITHSLDSALAQRVALNCRYDQEPIPNLIMIHDSFATTPNRIDQLQKIIRQSAVELFSTDYLDSLYQQWKRQLPENEVVKLPIPPEKGDLNINEVVASSYFFS